jgi:hypothetical protein
MKLPVSYKGKTINNGWHRYFAYGPLVDHRAAEGFEYSVHIDSHRSRAWFWAWATWLCRKILKREI